MKIRTKKTLSKRFKLSHPKRGISKLVFTSPGFAHGFTKRRVTRNIRGKNSKTLSSHVQSKELLKYVKN